MPIINGLAGAPVKVAFTAMVGDAYRPSYKNIFFYIRVYLTFTQKECVLVNCNAQKLEIFLLGCGLNKLPMKLFMYW